MQDPLPHNKLVVLRTEDGQYVGRRGRETILVEKARAIVWDWDADNVEASLAEVKRQFGATWTPEPAPTK